MAKQSGSRVGAARFDAQKFDAIQKLQGGQGTLSKGQREKAREAARIQGEAAYTAMRNTGQFKDEMFEGDRPGVAIDRKSAARFKTDDIKEPVYYANAKLYDPSMKQIDKGPNTAVRYQYQIESDFENDPGLYAAEWGLLDAKGGITSTNNLINIVSTPGDVKKYIPNISSTVCFPISLRRNSKI